MKYKAFIEARFLIDEATTGKLVPFIFNKVQNKYYQELCDKYDIENKGLTNPIREIILKARREGFSSFILGLFAADDILQDNPTETLVISYKDEATKTFRTRYRRFLLSFGARKAGYTVEQIQKDPNILEDIARIFLSIDANEIELKHNKAHFYCGTASARTGGRGGVLQKVLFSEAAHYPDTERMTAREIIDGTLRQVDINSGWAFIESTANGFGNYYELTWTAAINFLSRFCSRFFGWREFYTEAEFKLIASEFPDKQMLKQEYPETAEEAFLVTGSPYFNNELIFEYLKRAEEPIEIGTIELIGKRPLFRLDSIGYLKIYRNPEDFASYTMGGDTAEGLEGGDYSVLTVIDNKTLRTVAKYRARISPDEFAKVAFALGMMYNQAYTGIEVNKDGLWVNTELFKMGYPNLYYREAIDDITNKISAKVGFKTDERTRPYILSELQKMISSSKDIWNDKDFLQECLVFVRNRMGRPGAMNGKNDDCIFAYAIAYEIRRNAPEAFINSEKEDENISYVQKRLDQLYKKNKDRVLTQSDYL